MLNTEKKRSGLIRLALAMVIALVFLGLFSKNSFLYPMNDWVDENCFFTVGRAMLDGKVLYRDIFEQKGPVVYFVFAIASLVSKTSFIGAFIIEWLSFTAFLYGTGEILCLYRPNSGMLALFGAMLITAFSVTVSISFSHGGSVEELSLSMLTLSLLITLRAVKKNETVRNANALCIGAFSAIVFWSKFTMLGFFIGLCIAYIIYMMRQRQLKKLAENIFSFALGALGITLPIIICFAMDDALDSLFRTYFYCNIAIYPQMESSAVKFVAPFVNIFKGFAASIYVNGLCTVLLALGAFRLIARFKTQRNEALIVFVSFVSLLASTFIGGKSSYSYYALILDCFAPLGAASAIDYAKRTVLFNSWLGSKLRVPLVSAYVALLLAIGFLLSRNTYLLKYKREDMPQYKFAKRISKQPDATLLNYGFLDGGFYLAANKTPPCKYFCKLNLKLNGMNAEQRQMIKERRATFVVTRGKPLEVSGLDHSGYILVETAVFPFEGHEYLYYLYERVP